MVTPSHVGFRHHPRRHPLQNHCHRLSRHHRLSHRHHQRHLCRPLLRCHHLASVPPLSKAWIYVTILILELPKRPLLKHAKLFAKLIRPAVDSVGPTTRKDVNLISVALCFILEHGTRPSPRRVLSQESVITVPYQSKQAGGLECPLYVSRHSNSSWIIRTERIATEVRACRMH